MTKPELTAAITALKSQAAQHRCTSAGTELWREIKRLEWERTRQTKTRLAELERGRLDNGKAI